MIGTKPVRFSNLPSTTTGDPLKSTIFAASVIWRGPRGHMLVEDPRIDLLPDGPAGPRRFKIKTAESTERRGRVNSLLKDRYGWRGYQQVSLPTDPTVSRFTLTAVENEQVIGTITVAFDNPGKLGADGAFSPEVDQLRAQGATRVLVATDIASRGLLGRQVFIEMHLIVDAMDIENAHRITEEVEALLEERFQPVRILIHIEPPTYQSANVSFG